MIFAVSFKIIIRRAVGNEPCYLIKKKKHTLLVTVCTV
jgi:hypothetical protein